MPLQADRKQHGQGWHLTLLFPSHLARAEHLALGKYAE